ncbi:MAG TPA: response regulator, partial [Anaeromyxobacter sp.]|nr:response regulator [Anaeromyxobacter sp.]
MRTYLIVDDNRDFAENLAEIVRDLGDDVVVASDGREAVARARERVFDALLTDMRMPFMGGAEVVHEIRRIDPGAPAMVITAHVGDDAIEAARREGLLAVLPKPVDVPRLLELLRVARRDGLVAVIEDDVRLSDNLCEALRGRGFAAVTASSVLETERLGPV